MAVVGHGLLGLALAGSVPARARGDRLRYLWPGILVLLAYAVDLAEWFTILIKPDLVDRRLVTHAPWLVAGLAGGACAVFGLVFRFRRPWAYAAVAVAVFSHVLLDSQRVRIGLFEWYFGRSPGEDEPLYPAALLMEVCVYGAPLVWALLIRAAIEPGVLRPARSAAWVLAALSAVALVSRKPAVWGPVYALSAVHASLVLRRHVNFKLLWNGVPLLPLAVMALATGLVWYRVSQGHRLAAAGFDREAVRAYRSALDVPTRGDRMGLYLRLGRCYERLQDLPSAERVYQQALIFSPVPDWPELVMADFYARHPRTLFYLPDRSVELYTQLLESPKARKVLKDRARAKLQRLREHREGR